MLDYWMRREAKAEKSAGSEEPVAAEKTVSDESAKQLAMAEADRFSADEAGAVEFILKCGFADARLRAAQHVHAKPLAERVLSEMRKVDRRVAKLMQGRLDAMAKKELMTRHAEDCIAAAHLLLQETPLMPNRVADIDRLWRSIGEVEEPQQSRFAALRAEMDARLTGQTTLQRSAINLLERLREAKAGLDGVPLIQAEEAFRSIAQDWERCQQTQEAQSLPRSLLSDFEHASQAMTERLALRRQNEAQVQDMANLLNVWELVDAASLDADALKREWGRFLSSDASVFASVQQRFNVLMQRVSVLSGKKSNEKSRSKAADDSSNVMGAVLQKLEQAVQDGHLHDAMAQDEILRKMDFRGNPPGRALMTRLTNARVGLKRLQGWARWSGNISRETLIRSVEDLSAQKMALPELAQAVIHARDHWKTMDVQSGAAPKALWDRFDAACTTAYAPVAEQARKQALERLQNKERAEALIADILRFAEENGLNGEDPAAGSRDWKRVAGFYQGVTLSWSRIGYMDRKDRKRVNAQFEQAIQAIMQPLRKRWMEEIEKREALIQEVEQIEGRDRPAADRVRAIQRRWQECAKAMPLEHKKEQMLWDRFRRACDAVFAQRKASSEAADAVRQQNADNKLALCVALENARDESEAAIRDLLRETEAAWKRIRSVPRAVEQKIEGRYRKAAEGLRARLKASATAAKQAQRDALIEKMKLCRIVENAVTKNLSHDPVWNERWQNLPVLHGDREQAMRKRFDAAVKAATTSDRQYADRLETNRAILEKELLRAEIMAGLESPPELSRQRLQIQVEVLQSTMSGRNTQSLDDLVNQLCLLPALTDDAMFARLERLTTKTGQRNAV